MLLEKSISGDRCKLGHIILDIRRKLLALLREADTKLQFKLATVRQSEVFRKMLLHGTSERLSVRVLGHELLVNRILHECSVDLDVCIVVLIREHSDRLAGHDRHILCDGVHRHGRLLRLNDQIDVLHVQCVEHLPVKKLHVVHIRRRSLSKLHRRLILHDLLCHCCGVGVGNRDNVNPIIEVFCPAEVLLFGVVGDDVLVLRPHVFLDHVSDKLELAAERIVYTRLNGRHDLHRTLKERKGCADGSLGVCITNIHLGDRADAATLINEVAEKLVKNA